jgi:hypothetical protein
LLAIIKEEMSPINSVSAYLKKLERQKQNKPEAGK